MPSSADPKYWVWEKTSRSDGSDHWQPTLFSDLGAAVEYCFASTAKMRQIMKEVRWQITERAPDPF